MKFIDWKNLSKIEQESKCQDLNAYEEWGVFKGVEAEFLKQYGEQPGIGKVHCGLGPCMGPYNSIVVNIRKGQRRTSLPKVFMGFPVLREYPRGKIRGNII